MINDWETRPLDHRNLLNPAFCGVLLIKAAKEYEDLAGNGMPLSLVFLILPLVVPTQIRALLPTTSAASFPAWVHAHPEARLGLAANTREMIEVTRQAILFCVQRNALSVNAKQFVSAVPRKLSSSDALTNESARIDDMIRRSRFLGRWLARSGEPATIYFLLGLQP